ncbi:hypothetical protein A2U01_0100313, partial [Trifolium medium]|nr:hypothetical protein [Trifolium medium]
KGKTDTANAGTAVATPKRKRADKEKTEKVVDGKKKKFEVRASGVVTKKPRTQKKKAP